MKTKILSFFLLCLIFVTEPVCAQSPTIVWQKTYGSFDGDYAHSITRTSDGGFITVGFVEAGSGDVVGYHGNRYLNDTWVLKLSGNGEIEWKLCLGGISFEQGCAIKQTPDGGYAVLSTSSSVDGNMTKKGGVDLWLVKLSATGNIVWQKSVGGSKNDYAYGLDLTPDGGFILCGDTESSNGDVTMNHGMRDYLVAKLDGNGNLQWLKTFGGTQDDVAFGIRSVPGGGFVIAGSTESNDGDVSGNHGLRDYWVVKLDDYGNMKWQKCFGGSRFDEAWAVTIAADGTYVVAGYCASADADVSGKYTSSGDSDFWIVAINPSGSIIWQKTYGGSFNEVAYAISATPDGGIAVTGSAESHDGDLSCNAGITDMWIIKLSSTGALEWKKDIGGSSYDIGYAIDALPDGTVVIAGQTCSPQVPGYHPSNNGYGSCSDFFILKLSPPGPLINPTIKISPSSGTFCAGNQVIFKASVSNAPLLYSLQWTLNGVAVGGNGPEYLATTLNDNDKITCTITDADKCANTGLQATDQTTVKLIYTNLNPSISITSDKNMVCDLDAVIFKAAVLNPGREPSFQWQINGIDAGNNSAQYIVGNLKDGDVVTCIYSDPTVCLVNSPVASNPIKVSVAYTQPVSVTVSGPAGEVCTGTFVSFTAVAHNAGPNPAYQWKINGADAGTNSSQFSSSVLADKDIVQCVIDADNSFTCGTGGVKVPSNQVMIAIAAKTSPSVSITSNTQMVCEGYPVTFTARCTNVGANPSFSWKVNGIITGINSSQLVSSTLADGDVISCDVSVDPGYSCTNFANTNSNSIVVHVTKQLGPSLSISASENDVCPGTVVAFHAVALNAGSGITYKWNVNNKSVNVNASDYATTLLKDGDRIYCSIIPGSNQCSASEVFSNTITAVIRPVPVITMIPADTLVKAGTELNLKGVVQGSVVSYQWTPEARLNGAGTLTPVTTRLTERTVYTLKVTNAQGCTASSTAVVQIFRPLMMPDAFSPDGDGLNEVYRIPLNTDLKLKQFSIFDRWGNKVFSTTNISKGWDGRLNGKLASTGIYLYVLQGTNESGDVTRKGRIMLIR